jgi:hypothetical protein
MTGRDNVLTIGQKECFEKLCSVILPWTSYRADDVLFAPHTTQVFQILDLTLFGVLNRCPRYELPLDENLATVKVVMQVYHDFTHTIVRPNVLEAFRALGLEFDTRIKPYCFYSTR